MTPTRLEFYSTGCGDALVNPARYPREITRYLAAECALLELIPGRHLVEVGCMQGRYLDYAMDRGLDYLGVDVVARYIEEGRRRVEAHSAPTGRARFALGSATDLHHILNDVSPGTESTILFPFNSFGNCEDPLAVLRSLGRCGRPFLISSYRTSEEATTIREAYYRAAGLRPSCTSIEGVGVCFTAPGGFEAWAYEPQYLSSLATEVELDFSVTPLASVGLAYTPSHPAMEDLS